jgi:hypothetical protein
MLFFIGCHAGVIKNHPELNSSWIPARVNRGLIPISRSPENNKNSHQSLSNGKNAEDKVGIKKNTISDIHEITMSKKRGL